MDDVAMISHLVCEINAYLRRRKLEYTLDDVMPDTVTIKFFQTGKRKILIDEFSGLASSGRAYLQGMRMGILET